MAQTMLKLPLERARQLKALAEAQGTTITDIIEKFIEREIADGRIPPDVPGFEIEPIEDYGRLLLAFRMTDFWLPRLTPADARNLADLLDEVAEGRSGKNFGKKIVAGTDSLAVARIGRGVVLAGYQLEEQVVKHAITPGIARDLARQLRTAVRRLQS